MSDRKRAIETLKQLRLDYEEFYEEHNNEVTHAYDMAIASLEVDEAYQLEYETTTKNDLGVESEDCISRKQAQDEIYCKCQRWSLSKASNGYGQDVWNDYMISSKDAMQVLKDLPSVYPKSDNSVLEDIQTEIQKFREITEDKNIIATIDYISAIVDKHISGKVLRDGNVD